MRVFITGIAGAIGSSLAERLRALGHEVSGIDSLTPFYDVRLKEMNLSAVEAVGVPVTRGDIREVALAPLIEGCDVVFHLAAQPGISALTPFQDYLDNNIVATARLLDVLTTLKNPPHVMYGSTSSVYGVSAKGDEATEPRPTSNYGVTKLASEQLALARHRDSGLPVTSLRLFSVYGERERPEKFFIKLIRAIHEDTEFPLHEGSEEHVRSFTYIGDILDGLVAAMERRDAVNGEIVNIGTDVTATTGEGLALVQELSGKKANIKRLPPRPGDQKETAAHIEKARRLLGYSPKTSLREGLQKQIEWYRTHIHGKL
jgi:nucleoside-diphosphate-sugar epimerase